MVKPLKGSKEEATIKAGSGRVPKAPRREEESEKRRERRGISFFKKGVRKRCPSCGWVGTTDVKKCPKCTSELKTERGPLGYLMSFGIYFGIIFVMLNFVFGKYAVIVSTWGLGSPVWIIAAMALFLGFILTFAPFHKGILYCVGIVVVLGFLVPSITPVSAWIEGGEIPIIGGLDIGCWLSRLFSDPQSIQECYTQVRTIDPFDKPYESLDVIFGEKILGEYIIPTVYASKEDEPEPYFLPFYIKNKNSIGSGLKISDIDIEYVEAIEATNSSLSFEAERIEPKTMDLEPGEEKIVYAENFNSIDGTYVNIFPCEETELKRLDFETKLSYEQNVTHKRTLAVVRSREDEALLSEDPNLRSQVYTIESPSAGPVDLAITFTTPYVIGSRSKVTMNVWVVNRESGIMKFISDKNIVVKPIGGLPYWITLDPLSDKCSEKSNGDIEIDTQRYVGARYSFGKDIDKQFICDFEISGYPTESAYQLINFEGRLEYEYIETNSFSENVDRSTFC